MASFSLRPVQSVLSFLTILPSGKSGSGSDIRYIAKNMHIFPVAGLVIGLIAGAIGYASIFVLHPLLAGLIITAALVILTGVHHTDALADFADGLMAKGGKEIKRKAMLDPAVGSAGVAALVLYFAGMITVFYTAPQSGLNLRILTGLVASEVIAKYIMVLLAYRGLSAWEGFSSPFTAAMKDKKRMLAATGIMLPIVWVCAGYTGIAALAASIVIAGIMLAASRRSFGGISGDVLGASNEVARLSSLIVIFSVAV